MRAVKVFRNHALGVAFLACFLAVGVPYWRIPYRTVSLPSTLMTPGLVVVALAAFLQCLRRVRRFGPVALVVGASVPSVVAARVLVEAVIDPTSHNLWPFEIAIAAFVGLACALAGAAAGSLIARLSPASSDARPS